MRQATVRLARLETKNGLSTCLTFAAQQLGRLTKSQNSQHLLMLPISADISRLWPQSGCCDELAGSYCIYKYFNQVS